MFSSTAEAAEYQGGYLGEFVRMGEHNNRPYYRQRDTEDSRDVFLYYCISSGWWVNDILGESSGWLWNNKNTDLAPRANWAYWWGKEKWKVFPICESKNSTDGKWSEDDQTLKLDYTTLSPCNLVTVAGSGGGWEQRKRMGEYRFASRGRPYIT